MAYHLKKVLIQSLCNLLHRCFSRKWSILSRQQCTATCTGGLFRARQQVSNSCCPFLFVQLIFLYCFILTVPVIKKTVIHYKEVFQHKVTSSKVNQRRSLKVKTSFLTPNNERNRTELVTRTLLYNELKHLLLNNIVNNINKSRSPSFKRIFVHLMATHAAKYLCFSTVGGSEQWSWSLQPFSISG